MGKYSKFKSDFYNGCGYLFLLVVLVESLGLLIGRGGGGEALLSSSPIVGAIINILLAFVHILALVGSLNIADRLNKAIKPV